MKKSDLPVKICATCQRPFAWRKKWEKNWEEVKYCSDRCRGNRGSMDLDRVIRMAWEDRTPFDAIEAQFGLKEDQVIDVMRRELEPACFRAWRKRVHENGNLKDRASRSFKLGAFKSRMQRIDGSTKDRARKKR